MEGHWAKQCQKPKKTRSVGKKTEHANINVSNEPSDDSKHYLFLTTSSDEKIEGTAWCIDPGASQHMINKREFIENYREFRKPELVQLGDDREVKAFGKGNILIKLLNSGGICKSVEMKDVLYVPALTKNLLSVSELTRKGYTISFGQEKFVILNNEGTVLVSGKLNGKLYELDTAVLNKSLHFANSANVNDFSEEFWHQRYGHLNKKSLRDLQSQDLVDGISFNISENENKEACEGCLKGKQIRQSFPKEQANRAAGLLDLIHTDVCGPMPTKSHGGNSYFVTFIDDKSRFTAIYFMKRKDEVLSKFKEFEAMAQNITGRKIKYLRSDNGGEYTSNAFVQYLTSKGIQHQFTIPRTPEQNGIAESMNRTLQESGRSMLHGAGLPDSFWAE